MPAGCGDIIIITILTKKDGNSYAYPLYLKRSKGITQFINADGLSSAKRCSGQDLERKETTDGIGQLHGEDIRRRF
jgi:hypothetical protein